MPSPQYGEAGIEEIAINITKEKLIDAAFEGYAETVELLLDFKYEYSQH